MKPLNKVFIFLFLVVPVILTFAQQEQTEDQIYDFFTVEEKPVVVTDAQPVYPQSAIDQGIDGTVVIKVVIDKNGRVSSAEVFRSIPQLDNAALQAARAKVFSPGMVGGAQVNTEMNIPIEFVLPADTYSDAAANFSTSGDDVVDLTADAVVIKAEPDRPRVNIISDRIKPEFDNINLEKSFRQELLGRSERIVIIKRSQDEAIKSIDIKQILNRTR
jgi:TonB family protein